MSVAAAKRRAKPGPVARAWAWLTGKRTVAYEAASTADKGRRNWTTSNAGPNAVGMSAARLRARSRDMARNDAHCARAINVLAGNIVGAGVTTHVRTPKDATEAAKALAELYESMWRAWSETGADLEGVHTREALEGVIVRGLVEAGEVFIRRHIDLAAWPVPLRLEVLEADQCDESKNERLEGGGRIVQGVELDARGRRVAYHFLREHPGEGHPWRGGRTETIRVPAEDVIHLFVPLRPGQVRGLPFLAPVLAAKADLDTFERFELARKQTEAAVAAFIVPGDNAPTEEEGLAARAVDSDGTVVEDIQPRLIVTLRNGKDVRFNSPAISANYDTYKRSWLQSIAVGVMLSYEWLSGDLSQANYSSLRAGQIEFWRHIESIQYAHFVPKVSARVWRWFCEAAFLAGRVPSPRMDADFTAPARQSVDPARESLGDVIDIRAGLVPHADRVAARGFSPRRVLEEAAELQRELGILGLILDIDASRVDFRGAMRNDRRQGQGAAPPADGGTDPSESAP